MTPMLARVSATTAAKAAQGGLGLVLTAWLARWLGAGAYGGYATAMAVAQLGAVAAAMGLPQLAARDAAAHAARGAWGLHRGLARHLRRHAGLVGGGAAVLGFAAWWLLPGVGAATAFATAALTALLVALRLLGQWNVGSARPVLGDLGDGALRRGLFLVLLAILAAIVPPSGATALAAHAGAAALALGLAGSWTRRGDRTHPPIEAAGSRHAAALPFLGVAGLNALMANVDVLMLGALAAPDAAGPYAVAARLAEVPALLLLAVNAAAAPYYARAEARDGRPTAARPARWTARGVGAVALLAVAAAWLVGGPLLNLLGDGFAKAHPALLILAAAQTVNAACGAAALLLDTAGMQHRTLIGVAAGAGVNVALNATLIPLWGLVGAAVATGTGLATWNGWLAVAAWRRLGIDPTPLGRPPRIPA